MLCISVHLIEGILLFTQQSKIYPGWLQGRCLTVQHYDIRGSPIKSLHKGPLLGVHEAQRWPWYGHSTERDLTACVFELRQANSTSDLLKEFVKITLRFVETQSLANL